MAGSLKRPVKELLSRITANNSSLMHHAYAEVHQGRVIGGRDRLAKR
jgi:hypothetical protein